MWQPGLTPAWAGDIFEKTEIREGILVKALFIGGTGTISSPISALRRRIGNCTCSPRQPTVAGRAIQIQAEIRDEADVRRNTPACVLTWWWILYRLHARPGGARRAPVRGKDRQYIFISSASAYQKRFPAPLSGEHAAFKPIWQYSRIISPASGS